MKKNVLVFYKEKNKIVNIHQSGEHQSGILANRKLISLSLSHDIYIGLLKCS